MFPALVPWSRMLHRKALNLRGTILLPIGASLQTYEIHLHFSQVHGGKKIAPVN